MRNLPPASDTGPGDRSNRAVAPGPTAFVLAGGGSLGAVQVGMLKAMIDHGILPDFIVGTSVGAINAAFIAGNPTTEGAAALEGIWRRLHRRNVFPLSAAKSVLGVFGVRNHLVNPASLADLVMEGINYERLEDAALPCIVVATDVLEGSEVEISSGPLLPALLASSAIPAVFPPVRYDGRLLVDGGIANNTPISTAVRHKAGRIIVLPTGISCALDKPPRGALAMAMHAINLLIMRQMIRDYERYCGHVRLHILPPLCPLSVNPFDFSRTGELIDRAETSTRAWLEEGGLSHTDMPHELEPHTHDEAGPVQLGPVWPLPSMQASAGQRFML